MATINPADYRTKQQQTTLYLSILQPFVLLTAAVNNGAIARGARTIAYDGGVAGGVDAFAAIAAGQTLEVDTPKGTEKVRIKAIAGAANVGTLTVAENEIAWGDGYVLRVLHTYEPWPIPPTIRSGVFYKDYDVAYTAGATGQNSQPPPVAILGPHFATTVNAIYIGNAAATNASYAVTSGATISGWSLACLKSDGTVVAPVALPGDKWGITLPSCGQYWLSLTVTDSNGKTATTHRCCWYYDFVTCSPYIDFQLNNLNGEWSNGGWRFSLLSTGDVDLSEFPNSTIVVVWCLNYFDDVEGYVTVWPETINVQFTQIVCSGYLRKDTDNDILKDGVGNAGFEVTTLENVMEKMSLSGSVSLNSVGGIPATWYEYENWMTVGRAVHHLLKWHSTILEICDVYGLTDNLLLMENANFAEGTLIQMINALTMERGILSKIVADRWGRLHLTVDTQLLNDTDRGLLDTVFTLTTADVSDTVELQHNPDDKFGVIEVGGYYFDGATATPYISIAGGYQSGGISFGLPGWRGAGSDMKNLQVLASQADCNQKAGRLLAAVNNDYKELRITTPANYLGAYDIVPTLGFYEWGLADALFKRGFELNGLNLICRGITVNAVSPGVLQQEVVFEIEAQGEDGIIGNYPAGYPTAVTTTPAEGGPSPIYGGAGAFVIVYTGTTLATFISGTKEVSAGVVISATSNYNNSPVVLSRTKVLLIYTDRTSLSLSGMVLDLSGDVISANAPDDYGFISLETGLAKKITSTTAIVPYNITTAPNNTAYCAIATISGTSSSISAGTKLNTEVFAAADAWGEISVSMLSTTKAIACWFENVGAGDTRQFARILTVSGGVLVAGTAYEVSSFNLEGYYGDVVSLTETTAVALNVYWDSVAAKAYLLVVPLLIAGDLITPGTGASMLFPEYYASLPTPGVKLVRLTDTTFAMVAITHRVAWGNGLIRLQAGSVAANVISIVGANVVDLTGSDGAGAAQLMACDVNNGLITVIYRSATNVLQRRTVAATGVVLTDLNDITTNGENFTGGGMSLVE